MSDASLPATDSHDPAATTSQIDVQRPSEVRISHGAKSRFPLSGPRSRGLRSWANCGEGRGTVLIRHQRSYHLQTVGRSDRVHVQQFVDGPEVVQSAPEDACCHLESSGHPHCCFIDWFVGLGGGLSHEMTRYLYFNELIF